MLRRYTPYDQLLRDFLSTAAIGRPTDTKLLSGAAKHPLINCQEAVRHRWPTLVHQLKKSPPLPPGIYYRGRGGGEIFEIDIRVLGVHKSRANILTTCKSIIAVHSGVIIFSKFSSNKLAIGFLTFFFSKIFTFFYKLQFLII